MIKKLSIRNFRCHESFDLELSPRITTIIGQSDSGKSTVLNALRWLVTNKPGGDSFFRHGATKPTKVGLVVDKHKITREKGEENLYTIDGKKLTAFGANVPDEILSVLNLGEVNFQRQLEPSWWLFLSPGEVSKQLNAIVNLDQIDTVLSDTAAALRKSRSQIEDSEERIQQHEKDLAALSWVEEANRDYQLVDNLNEQLGETRQKCTRIDDLLSRLGIAQVTAENASTIDLALGNAIQEGERLLELERKVVFLEKIIKEYEEGVAESEIIEVERKKIEQRMAEMMVGTCPVCGASINL